MRLIEQAREVLEGWPSQLLTVAMLAAAGVIIAVALFAPPLAKAAVLAWVVMP